MQTFLGGDAEGVVLWTRVVLGVLGDVDTRRNDDRRSLIPPVLCDECVCACLCK